MVREPRDAMKSDNEQEWKAERRNVIKSGIATGFGISGLAGLAAGQEDDENDDEDDNSSADSFVTLNEDGELEVDGTQSNAPSIQTQSQGVEVDRAAGVAAANDLVHHSNLKYVQRDGTVFIEGDFQEATTVERTHDYQIASACGKNDLTVKSFPTSANIYLDEFWAGQVCGGMGIIAALAGAGVISGPGAIPAWVVAAVSGVGAVLICRNNKGCGVRIRVYPGGVVKVDPQDDSNISWI